jgi:hypothetical protein
MLFGPLALFVVAAKRMERGIRIRVKHELA